VWFESEAHGEHPLEEEEEEEEERSLIKRRRDKGRNE